MSAASALTVVPRRGTRKSVIHRPFWLLSTHWMSMASMGSTTVLRDPESRFKSQRYDTLAFCNEISGAIVFLVGHSNHEQTSYPMTEKDGQQSWTKSENDLLVLQSIGGKVQRCNHPCQQILTVPSSTLYPVETVLFSFVLSSPVLTVNRVRARQRVSDCSTRHRERPLSVPMPSWSPQSISDGTGQSRRTSQP